MISSKLLSSIAECCFSWLKKNRGFSIFYCFQTLLHFLCRRRLAVTQLSKCIPALSPFWLNYWPLFPICLPSIPKRLLCWVLIPIPFPSSVLLTFQTTGFLLTKYFAFYFNPTPTWTFPIGPLSCCIFSKVSFLKSIL